MSNLILYHGSPDIVRKPSYGKGKLYNDYGQGFYCTQDIELAREWSCGETTDGYVNRYELNPSSLSILNLTSKRYTILHWLALLLKYRTATIPTPIMSRSIEFLTTHFLLSIEDYDAIIGYRADDSYFSFARAFASNEISLGQLSYAMKLGNLGEQFVLKSPRAFELIQFISCEPTSREVYYPKRRTRAEGARAAFRAQLEREELDGLFIRDIIREEIGPNDPRLQ